MQDNSNNSWRDFVYYSVMLYEPSKVEQTLIDEKVLANHDTPHNRQTIIEYIYNLLFNTESSRRKMVISASLGFLS